ncbi:hypothetical protein M431DRAFT_334038 [Trichoderma harzianum CBS 226.95]|uniref:Uncharacterized protein n=1 Tax=Trichoderma harzianum CBS 226.95 TaxID=983964 RepID=A0A2T3ZTQ9_TRIHA|nr:hypothetical protein M431DRAFT_334038 [Trichoderma harzianum CBS 226.95]PTB48177.1 hypothetical protein M431DRAFT_334038 [Trichoderma harzianum CBS 226.95]
MSIGGFALSKPHPLRGPAIAFVSIKNTNTTSRTSISILAAFFCGEYPQIQILLSFSVASDWAGKSEAISLSTMRAASVLSCQYSVLSTCHSHSHWRSDRYYSVVYHSLTDTVSINGLLLGPSRLSTYITLFLRRVIAINLSTHYCFSTRLDNLISIESPRLKAFKHSSPGHKHHLYHAVAIPVVGICLCLDRVNTVVSR